MASTAPQEGRRERKKRETRRRISDIATGLFLDRGFDAVTIAEIAEAADVSVNTVYNYFPTKEDLFFDREEEVIDRPSRFVRERQPGESAARAVLGRLRADIEDRSVYAGTVEGYGKFMRCIHEAPSLLARMMLLQYRTAERLTSTLAEEAGAGPDDPMPQLVAGELVHISNQLFRGATRSIAAGKSPEQTALDALRKLDTYETLVSERFLNYAVKPG
ncbi:helix-turn-helix transcriptional regulator [Streptomyces oryzae]|uniref:Helix-turn-helix transcriptional regulator n=1 Tax=Streptomyces oryzae TaxID=1434886 RepID=A0ABS3X9I7_9ACTN|nr:TetR family transcriptional regulator [Streptomyces oryzae]MBO8192050.1 helix-turn-helix transcriptional regulator [Streptomyces oryzae]